VSFVAVVLTPVLTKQIIIKLINETIKKSKYQYTHYKNTHTLQNNYGKIKKNNKNIPK
jgi:hypothetical protein